MVDFSTIEQTQQQPAGSAGRGPRNRPHASQACERCKRKKSRCDGNEPCGRCRGLGVSCTFTSAPDRRRVLSKAEVMALHARISALEAEKNAIQRDCDAAKAENDTLKARLAGHGGQPLPSSDYFSSPAQSDVRFDFGGSPLFEGSMYNPFPPAPGNYSPYSYPIFPGATTSAAAAQLRSDANEASLSKAILSPGFPPSVDHFNWPEEFDPGPALP
ncbi:hypothetical protein EXIGLDRAFT_833872 [Exidia glandulosa HHB12029]|uniref:Zn(2)-C6 fungal-type domain-containing protein n=1 Tax=Exidia glandulosa HHB12029 TaxID=1314781 RepID=A0A165KBF3_EXIGL|nr:hypothetical protein EXIGLDRAFT_833872 [Exidia glandulosa HHB12029]